MSSGAQILEQEFNKIRIDLIKAYEAKGMRASGQWANSLEVFASDLQGGIIGLNYSQQLETGRRAGKYPPIQAIEQWIVDKGIPTVDISISSLAFLIARKISREGWDRSRFGGVELISEVVTDERIQSIIDKYGDAKAVEFSTDVVKLLKQVA